MAISPEISANSRQLISEKNLEFEILFDKENEFADRLDLKQTLPEDLQKLYGSFGINLESANGSKKWELPLPGRFVVDKGGIIRAAEFSADYTSRPEPVETLNMVKSLTA